MREPGTKFNTHINTVIGVSDNGNIWKRSKINIRITSDEKAETLSLSDGKYMLLVPYSEVEKVLKEARAARHVA